MGEIARGLYRTKPESQIRGSGYVIKSLEAAVWCFVHTDDFKRVTMQSLQHDDSGGQRSALHQW